MRVKAGFTLVELIIGMVVFSIVLVTVSTMVVSQSRQSVAPVFQIRAAAFAQSLADEIFSKAFDEVASRSGSLARCDEAQPCTAPAALGPEPGESRATFNDVDDYHNFFQSGDNFTNSNNQPIEVNGRNLYSGYAASVSVIYDANMDGVADTSASTAKLITIEVTTPDSDVVRFALYRWHF